MKLLGALWLGDELYGNERKGDKKRGLLVWPPHRLLEHRQSELHKVRIAPRPRSEQHAWPAGAGMGAIRGCGKSGCA